MEKGNGISAMAAIRWLLYMTVFLAPLATDEMYVPLVAAFLLFVYVSVKEKRRLWRVGPLCYGGTAFLGWSFLSLFRAPDGAASFFNWLCLPFSYALFYVLLFSCMRKKSDIQKALIVFGAGAFCVAVIGVFQYLDIRHMAADLTSQGWADPNRFPLLYRRMYSTLENPNLLGAYGVIILSGAASFFFCEKRMIRKLLMFFLCALMGGCLLLTYSRGAWLGGLIVFAGLAFFCERRLGALFLLLPVMLFFYHGQITERALSLFSGEDTSISLRFALWESTMVMIGDYPWLGIGWGAYSVVYPTYNFFIQDTGTLIYHAHNMMLHMAAETGLIGCLAYLSLFAVQAYCFFQMTTKRQCPFYRGAGVAGLLMTVAVMVMSLGDHVLFSRSVSFCFWGCSALYMAVTRMEAKTIRE